MQMTQIFQARTCQSNSIFECELVNQILFLNANPTISAISQRLKGFDQVVPYKRVDTVLKMQQ